MRIFVADDDAVVIHILSSMLETLGHEIECVKSGVECIETIRCKNASNELPQVIFLDLLLQDMKGSEVLKIVREIIAPKHIPVIMLSANSKREMLEMNNEAIPDYFLEKPFNSDDLAKAIEEVMPQVSGF